MDLYQLDCFRTVARMQHISNAAVVLHVTQPALSKIISRVEDYAGAPLFDRVKGKIYLNASGTAFLKTLDQVFELIDDGKREVLEISTRDENHVRLASSCDSILFMLAEKFFTDYPDVRMRYGVLTHEEIRAAFLKNSLDFALTTYPIQEAGIEWIKIMDEEILMLVGPESQFFDRKSVSFSELKGVEMMSESRGDLRDKLNSACLAAGFTPNVVLESTIGSIMGFNHGLRRAVCFVPAHRFMQMEEMHHLTNHQNAPLLRAVRLELPNCNWSMGIAKRPDSHLSPHSLQFYEMTRDYFSHLNEKLNDFYQNYFS